jgi:MSHA pilin protein MshD
MCGAPDRPLHEKGVTLVEVILFMLIVSIAVVSLVKALSQAVLWSADPMIQRQTMAIAESLIEEIDSQPYKQKDPYNPAGPDDAIGPEPGETRTGSPLPFDNPNDYSGYSETGIVAPDGSAVAGLGTYSANVVATQQAMGNIPATDGLLVTVTSIGPDGQPITMTTFRAMYAP